MAKKSGYGPSTAYTASDVSALLNAITAALRRRGDGGTPTKLTVKGRIEWNGEVRGDRTVNLDRLTLTRVLAAHQAAERAAGRGKSAGASYRQAGPRAQAKRLAENKAGREALAGMARPAQVAKWLAGTVTPSKANRDRIARAHEAQAEAVRRTGRERDLAHREEVISELNAAIAERYQDAEIRFRQIIRLDFE